MMTRLLLLPLALAFVAAGCGASGAAQEAGPLPTAPAATQAVPTEPAPTEPTTTPETAATTTEEAEPPPAPVKCAPETAGDDGVYMNLTDVRVGAHDRFDRIVFQFEEPNPNPAGNGGIPRFEIRQVKPPFSEDPSDIPIHVEGDAFVRIVFQGASGYDFDGNATYDGPRRLTPGFGTLAQAVEGGDFEATMTWLLGLSRPTCWEIHALHNPERVVIDFHHV